MTVTTSEAASQRQTHKQPKDDLQEADEEELDEPEDDNKRSLIPAV